MDSSLRAAAQQALEALESLFNWQVDTERGQRCGDAVVALRAALAEPVEPVKQCMAHGECFGGECIYQRPAEPVQEPVAWRWGYRSITTGEMDWRGYVEIAADPNLRSPGIIMQPLYAAPPQRLPLTEEEIDSIWDSEKVFPDIYAIARAIERAHGIV